MSDGLRIKLSTAASLLLFSTVVYADAGVPMLALAAPVFALSIIPIIIIEAFYLRSKLSINTKQAFKLSVTANVVSTVFGIPITWVLLVALEFISGGGSAFGLNSILKKIVAVTWQAPWLIPYEENLNWMIPIAGIVLLIPFFFVSWWSEYLVCKKLLKNDYSGNLKVIVRNANLITYGLMILWPIVFILLTYYHLN